MSNYPYLEQIEQIKEDLEQLWKKSKKYYDPWSDIICYFEDILVTMDSIEEFLKNEEEED